MSNKKITMYDQAKKKKKKKEGVFNKSWDTNTNII